MGGFLNKLTVREQDSLFVGVERNRDVLIRAMEKLLGLPNVRFISADAKGLSSWFSPGEIDALYLNFPDPWPHWKHASRRLTHCSFLTRYRSIMCVGGALHFKTDNAGLFRFTLSEMENCGFHILRADNALAEAVDNIPTEYETRYRERGQSIYYIHAECKGAF